jgi:hypothetical protein
MPTANNSPARDDIRPGTGQEAFNGHTYTNILIHALFSTKRRQPWLDSVIREEVFRYLGGVVNELGGQSLVRAFTS